MIPLYNTVIYIPIRLLQVGERSEPLLSLLSYPTNQRKPAPPTIIRRRRRGAGHGDATALAFITGDKN